jgi:micrococcal nuclease
MRWIVPLALTFCAGAAPVAPSTTPHPHRTYRAGFLSCYDGDTCDFSVHLGLDIVVQQTVRFYGIDTPELRGASRAVGLEVRDFVVRLLQRAHRIELQVPQKRSCGWLESCDERGRYGRLLANVLADGQSVNALLLRTGRAAVY